jgi:uncharacterized protein (TIGR03067 family)
MVLGLVLAMSLAFSASTDCAPPSDSSRPDADQLQGKWNLIYQEINGKKVLDEKEAEIFHGMMEFAGNKIHFSVELPGFDFRFSYRLFPDQHPKRIDLTLTETADGKGKGQTMLGIYRLKEGTLEICHSKTNRPTNFNAGEGTHQVLIMLKRAAKSP